MEDSASRKEVRAAVELERDRSEVGLVEPLLDGAQKAREIGSTRVQKNADDGCERPRLVPRKPLVAEMGTYAHRSTRARKLEEHEVAERRVERHAERMLGARVPPLDACRSFRLFLLHISRLLRR